MTIIFRDANREDAPAILAVWSAAFRREINSPQGRSFIATLIGPDQAWRVAENDGQLVAALCVKRMQLCIGQGYIVKGDVGQVSVLPDWQGQGLGSALMRDAVTWMHDHQYDFARLGGLVRFYSRFGYVPFPRRYVEFPLAATILTGATVEAPPYLAQPLDNRVGSVANKAEWQKCHSLLAEFTSEWIGAAVKATTVDNALPASGLNLVLREGGQILAYLHAIEHDTDRTEFESRLTIANGAYQSEHADTLVALIIHILQLAFGRGHQRVSARLPFHPPLFRALTAAQIPYKAVELHEAVASNMVQIVNLRTMFEHLQPELTRRWCRTRPQHVTSLVIACVGQRVALHLSKETVEVMNAPDDAPTLAISPDSLLAMVLGLHAPTYLLDCFQLPESDAAQVSAQYLLNILFPEQRVATSI